MNKILLNLYRWALVVVVLVISYLAVTPLAYPDAVAGPDKLLHAIAFLVVMLLVDFSWPDASVVTVKIASVFAYGVLIEIVQHFLPYRDFSIADMLADAMGIGLYFFMVPLLRKLPLLRLRWSR